MCYAFAHRINRTCKNLDDLAEGRGVPSWFSGLGEWMGDKVCKEMENAGGRV